MGLMTRLMRDLMPAVGPKLAAVRDALGSSLELLREAIDGIRREANPGAATSTLPRWYATLGLRYDASLPLATRRAIARQAFSNIGGQSLGALNAAVQFAFPNVYLSRPVFTTEFMVGIGMVGLMEVTAYPTWYVGAEDGSYPVSYYLVAGEVASAAERSALLTLLDRIAPAHMESVIGSLVILDQTETSETGLAMVGLAQVGRTKEDA